MKDLLLISTVLALIITPVSMQCAGDNCSETVPAKIEAIIPIIWGDQSGDGLFPLDAPKRLNSTATIFTIRITEVVSIDDPSKGNIDTSPKLGRMFENIFADIGLLDLSGRNFSNRELNMILKLRKKEGTAVNTLILSNSHIDPMDTDAFSSAEDTIETLVLDNTNAKLVALNGLNNLKNLNVSNNALTTLPWFLLMRETLQVLDLSNNKFDEVRQELSMLMNLRELYLSNNKIMVVEETPLGLLPNLEVLDLSRNVLLQVNFASLQSLKRLDVDWNFLRLMGDCRLPSQSLTLKLASNPWRCDCDLLQARDSNEILDIDQLQCVMNRNDYTFCVSCPRPFLPETNGLQVAGLTKKSIKHQGCTSIPEFYNFLSNEYVTLRQNEPEKLVQDMILFITLIVFSALVLILIIKSCCCQKIASGGKIWLKAQEIPKWGFDKLGNFDDDVPYIQIDKAPIKA